MSSKESAGNKHAVGIQSTLDKAFEQAPTMTAELDAIIEDQLVIQIGEAYQTIPELSRAKIRTHLREIVLRSYVTTVELARVVEIMNDEEAIVGLEVCGDLSKEKLKEYFFAHFFAFFTTPKSMQAAAIAAQMVGLDPMGRRNIREALERQLDAMGIHQASGTKLFTKESKEELKKLDRLIKKLKRPARKAMKPIAKTFRSESDAQFTEALEAAIEIKKLLARHTPTISRINFPISFPIQDYFEPRD